MMDDRNRLALRLIISAVVKKSSNCFKNLTSVVVVAVVVVVIGGVVGRDVDVEDVPSPQRWYAKSTLRQAFLALGASRGQKQTTPIFCK